MAEEKKEEKAKTVDAASSPRQDDGTASVRQQEGAPAEGGKDAAPAEGGKNAAPAEGGKDAAPAEAKSSQKSQPSQESQKSDAKSSEESGRAGDPSPAADVKPSEPDWKDLYARLRADFDNFKKRTARDREDTYRYAEADILKDVLPAVDNLALALANAVDAAPSPRQDDGTANVRQQEGAKPADAAPSPRQNKDESSASTAFVKGVQLVYDALLKSLKDHGAEPFDCVGKDLDTETMEAIATLPSATVAEGKVSNEVKRGWMLKGKVLRVAQVVVSSGKGQ